jgi:hypothetical protein
LRRICQFASAGRSAAPGQMLSLFRRSRRGPPRSLTTTQSGWPLLRDDAALACASVRECPPNGIALVGGIGDIDQGCGRGFSRQSIPDVDATHANIIAVFFGIGMMTVDVSGPVVRCPTWGRATHKAVTNAQAATAATTATLFLITAAEFTALTKRRGSWPPHAPERVLPEAPNHQQVAGKPDLRQPARAASGRTHSGACGRSSVAPPC